MKNKISSSFVIVLGAEGCLLHERAPAYNWSFVVNNLFFALIQCLPSFTRRKSGMGVMASSSNLYSGKLGVSVVIPLIKGVS